jgi:hypothetical protein
MAYSGDFTASQGANILNIILTDTSTGSDPALTGRTVYLYQTDNALLGGTTIDWPLSSGSTLTISDILTPWDFSLNILVTWQSSSPIPGSTYSKSHIATFTGNSNTFAYSLLQQISSNQAITRNTNYMYNLALVNSDILNAERARAFGDQGASQEALNRIYNFYVNRAFYF